jgi:hypothetical protein
MIRAAQERGNTVQIELTDAIKMYAKACRAWYGSGARKVALRRVHELRVKGDLEGVRVWEQLAAELTVPDAH